MLLLAGLRQPPAGLRELAITDVPLQDTLGYKGGKPITTLPLVGSHSSGSNDGSLGSGLLSPQPLPSPACAWSTLMKKRSLELQRSGELLMVVALAASWRRCEGCVNPLPRLRYL